MLALPGGDMKKREAISLIMLAMAAVAALLVSIGQFYVTGINGELLVHPSTQRLLMEIAVLFTVFFCILAVSAERRKRLGFLALTGIVFTWIHQVFLPVAVSGIYLVLIIRVGCIIRSFLDRDRCITEYHATVAMADFTLGSICLILLYCLMSAVGIGGIGWTRAAACIAGLLTFLPVCPGGGEREACRAKASDFRKEKKALPWFIAAAAAFILAMICLQAGRMNICADYDSLHYGLRSEYILNDGDGIYENMGSINVVYTYSKGLEILLLPLSGLPSFSYILSFQLWMTVGILVAAGEIVKLFVSRGLAVVCMAFLSSIPGIMNMGITAKTDSATALFQLIMIYFLLLFVKKRKSAYVAMAGDAFLMTMVLKPTALVFSTLAAGAVFLFLFATRTFRISIKERLFLSWIPAIAMWLMVWYRTWLFTGLPVTSVFCSIWQKLGFSVRYPFRFEELPSSGGGLGLKAAVKYFLVRLYGVLLAPVGNDMAHVRIAWGTPLMLIFLVLFLLPVTVRMKSFRKKEKYPFLCLVCVFIMVGAASLAALYLLWQVDGNYFILLYCLCTILAVIVIGKMESLFLTHAVVKILLPVLLFNVTVTAVTNWNGAVGLSPVSVAHAGYYDHRAEWKARMEKNGNAGIWGILEADPQTRVIVCGEQPEMLMFPCNTQSYTDIAGSGGNYYVSASVESLVEFFDYARTDYVYLCSGYLKPGTEAWDHVIGMMEEGYLTDIFYENGNGLARFTAEPAAPDDPGAVLSEFAQRYWPGEQQ